MESFVWMFKKEGFKKHFAYLFIMTVLFFMVSFGLIVQKSFILSLIGILIIFLSLFLLLGYMWELTGNVIDRTFDINANQIYDGKIKKVYNIELPELDIKKFIWRGFASVVANIILFLPYVLLIYIGMTNGTVTGFEPPLIILIVLFILLLPAILWNYAKENSIFSVLNIFKAVYIAGNYTFRYLKTFLLLAIVYSIDLFINNFIIRIINPMVNEVFELQNIPLVIGVLAIFIFSIIKMIYVLYVFAHIIGTIVPTQEG